MRQCGVVAFGMIAGVLLAIGLFLPAPLKGAESPDDLYAKGRYREAEQAYRKLDVDNPGDLRYRYNRGCAAFQAGNLDEARAAFTSVARRADTDDMRFRALYNLGNTAYKKNDFASARDSYRQALQLKPGDADARHNLELSLKALKKQQEAKNQQEGHKQGNQQQGQQQPGKNDKGGREKSGKDSPQDQGKGDEPQAGKQQGQQGGQEKGDKGQDGKQDLSGKLEGRNMGAGNDGQKGAQGMNSAAALEKRKAEALLDNVREDRGRARELKGGPGGHVVVGSGKEW